MVFTSRTIALCVLASFLLVLSGTMVHSHVHEEIRGEHVASVDNGADDAGCEFCKVTKYRVLAYSGTLHIIYEEIAETIVGQTAVCCIHAPTKAPCTRGPPAYNG